MASISLSHTSCTTLPAAWLHPNMQIACTNLLHLSIWEHLTGQDRSEQMCRCRLWVLVPHFSKPVTSMANSPMPKYSFKSSHKHDYPTNRGWNNHPTFLHRQKLPHTIYDSFPDRFPSCTVTNRWEKVVIWPGSEITGSYSASVKKTNKDGWRNPWNFFKR